MAQPVAVVGMVALAHSGIDALAVPVAFGAPMIIGVIVAAWAYRRQNDNAEVTDGVDNAISGGM